MEFRSKRDLSVPAFAKLIGAHHSMVYRWESGKFKPPKWVAALLD
jgi:DNA-binding transcriptional regulator YiaG